jgi:hypothetical protein
MILPEEPLAKYLEPLSRFVEDIRGAWAAMLLHHPSGEKEHSGPADRVRTRKLRGLRVTRLDAYARVRYAFGTYASFGDANASDLTRPRTRPRKLFTRVRVDIMEGVFTWDWRFYASIVF